MPSFSTFVATLAALAPLGALAAPAPIPEPAGWDVQPRAEISAFLSNAEAVDQIANSYIVVYNSSSTDDEIEAHQLKLTSTLKARNLGRRSLDGRQMSNHVKTFSFALPKAMIATASASNWRAVAIDGDNTFMAQLNQDPEVAYIEADTRVQALAFITETGSTNGLARLSSTAVGAKDYVFDDSAGAGITAYVVDTGVFVDHQEFEGRATMGFNAINNVDTDENGHGSHVAGTIAGATFGVAKKANIIGVKVLDAQGGGSNSGVIQGLQFVADDAKKNGRAGKAVMNMSLGGPASKAVNSAVDAIAAAGVVPVVAAGNENQDAANTSPASAAVAITVGAIDQISDAKASFSNFGASVDIFAPGVKVQSVGIKAKDATATLSGTSMASPHIAGLAAYLMALEKITDVAALTKRMTDLATASGASVKKNTKGTTNLIANNGAAAGAGGAAAPATPAAPAVPATPSTPAAPATSSAAPGAGAGAGAAQIPAGFPAATDPFWQTAIGKAIATLMGIQV